MKIQPTDWVLFTLNPCSRHKYLGGQSSTQFCQFDTLPEDWQYRLNRIYGHYNYHLHSLPPNKVGLRLHLVTRESGAKYGWKLKTLFKALESPIYSILNLPSGKHWLSGEMPKYGPARLLDGILPFQEKKVIAEDYLNVLCENIVEPESIPMNELAKKNYKSNNKIKLEEDPMKAESKKFLIELMSYDIDKKCSIVDRQYMVVNVTGFEPFEKDIQDIIHRSFVDSDDEWCLTHDILKIGKSHYKIVSGNMDYTDDRYNTFSQKGKVKPIHELDLTNDYYFHFNFNDNGTTGYEPVRIPTGMDIADILKYYQKKWPNKNYELKTEKVELVEPDVSSIVDVASIPESVPKETKKEKQELPKKGETSEKNTRKVCYKHIDKDKIFRGVHGYVEALVKGGEYEFVPKKAWKTQLLDKDGKVLVPGQIGHKSNITLPIDGSGVGDSVARRATQARNKQLKQTVVRPKKVIVGYAARTLQSKADKQKYQDKLKSRKKKRTSFPKPSRCFEAVIVDENNTILETIPIKATSQEHAEKILAKIGRNKQRDGNLTGNVRDWVKQSGKNRK